MNLVILLAAMWRQLARRWCAGKALRPPERAKRGGYKISRPQSCLAPIDKCETGIYERVGAMCPEGAIERAGAMCPEGAIERAGAMCPEGAILRLVLLLCLTPAATHGAVVPADPFRLPVRALDLMPHSTVGDSLNALLAQIGFRLNLETPRLGRRIAAQPLPQWVVRDEILTLRELIGEVVGPDVVLLIDPARRTVSLDMPSSVLGETATDTTLQGCLQVVALSGLLDNNGLARPQTAAAAAWRVVGNSAKLAALPATPLRTPTPAVAFEVVPIGLPGPATGNPAAMFPAEGLRYLAPDSRPAPTPEDHSPMIPAGGMGYLAPDSRPAPTLEHHSPRIPAGGMGYLAPDSRPAPTLEHHAPMVPAGGMRYLAPDSRPAPTLEHHAPMIPAGGMGYLAPDSRPTPTLEHHSPMIPAGGMGYLAPDSRPTPTLEHHSPMIPAGGMGYLAPDSRPAPTLEHHSPMTPAGGMRYLAPDSRPAPTLEHHAPMVPAGGMRYLEPTVWPAPIPENRAAIIAAEELKYVVAEGDTVSELARRFRPPGWSFRSTFDHIVENSPAALAGANPNHLRVGEVVSLPAPGEAGTIQPLPRPSPQPVLAPLKKPPPATYTLRLETGSLRGNLKRILADHGYTLGHWGFGSAEEEIDWRIPKGYSYTQPNDLAAVLRALGKTYRLRAVINELDQTVDFSPARAGGGP